MASDTTPVGRSDRLIQLIENANISAGVRMSASSQLGSYLDGLYKSSPDLAAPQSTMVLNKLVKLILSSKVWDVRMASGFAIEKSLMPTMQHEDVINSPPVENIIEILLKYLTKWDMMTFIDEHEPLVASSGAEFEIDLTSMTGAERLKQMRGELQKTLGSMQGIDDFTSGILDESDVVLQNTPVAEESNSSKGQGTEASSATVGDRELSSREKAMLRRRRSSAGPTVRISLNSGKGSVLKFPLPLEAELKAASASDSPLRYLLTLNSNLLNPIWSVRHGALVGINSILACIRRMRPGAGGCETLTTPAPTILAAIVAVIKNIFALLGLDRFSDFVGDQMIAPIRETAAQCLSLIVCLVPEEIKTFVWETCLHLGQFPVWQVRLSALIALKYIIAMDETQFSHGALSFIELAMNGCSDSDEDIQSLSAELLSRLLRQTSTQKSISESTLLDINVVALEILRPDAGVGNEEGPSSGGTIINGLDLLASVRVLLPSDSAAANLEDILSILLSNIRHPMISVRSKVLEHLRHIPLVHLSQSRMILMCRCLIQTILLDDDAVIREQLFTVAAALLASNHIKDKNNELLGAIVNLSTAALSGTGRPFQGHNFVFVTAMEGLSTITTPAAHEVGFKAADVMITNPEVVLQSRRMASRLISCMLEPFDTAVKEKVAKTLTGNDYLSRLVSLWIFSVTSPVATDDTSCDIDDLAQLRIWLAKALINPAGDRKLQQKIILDLLKRENILHQDVAALIRSVCSPNNAEEGCQLHDFVNVLLKRQDRQNALSILALCYLPSDWITLEQLDKFIALSLVAVTAKDENTAVCVLEELFSKTQLEVLLSPEVIESVWKNDLISELVSGCLQLVPSVTLISIVEHILPALNMVSDNDRRRALLSLIEYIFRDESPDTVQHASLFIVPVLRRIADADERVRTVAASLFSKLVHLIPLKQETTIANAALEATQRESQNFLMQFLGDSVDDLLQGGSRRISSIDEFVIPVQINADLRPYQRAGINWLAFLNRYGLNGALCDDMGLGKTLQTISMLASDHHHRHQAGLPHLSSLVICPASLLGHWYHELGQYAPTLGTPFLYAGTSGERKHRAAQLAQSQSEIIVVVTSYEVVRNDSAVLSQYRWNYIVLDEGHAIKNPRTKLTQAIKSLLSEHRLLLSGTPLQNSIVELWSLFDFLMPGLLGSEAEFMDSYGKAIMAVQPSIGPNSRLGSGGLREFEEAERKLKALHKQVLPFVLRRMKEDVLKDLPPKIIQDYECDPSPVQRLLYESYFNEKLAAELSDDVAKASNGEGRDKMHIFQTLQYLRKICIDPASVLNEEHPLWEDVQVCLAEMGCNSLSDISVSPKLTLLKELLQTCGIGEDNVGSTEIEAAVIQPPPAQHRVLIFAQQKSTLDLIERNVFAKHMPSVKYLRLDGSVEPMARFKITQHFNRDPSIDCLLLTTQIGGLGLNLTGADTVIFIEHDWNPMKDLQAMDRAHRLGQKRVVTVYRLIVKDTLEEQILGLQQWKIKVAATIVQQQDLSGDGNALAKAQPVNLLDLLASSNTPIATGLGNESKRIKRAAPANASGDRNGEMRKWLSKHGASLGPNGEVENVTDDYYDEYLKAFNIDNFRKNQ